MLRVKTAIIGAGFSGLFFARGLLNSGESSFCIIEKKSEYVGGFASSGGIKVSLLPAGEKTKNLLKLNDYNINEQLFLREFGKYLIKIDKTSDFDFSSSEFYNKYYESFILNKENAFKILEKIRAILDKFILYPAVKHIESVNGNFKIILEDEKIVESKYLIIASGRDSSIINLLSRLGQIYIHKHDLLFGCRATFDPNTAEKFFNYQPDFKIKNESGYQTYCFNYRGELMTYDYNHKKIYAGYFNENSNIGNCFIGNRLINDPENILKRIPNPISFKYNDLIRNSEDYLSGLIVFIDQLKNNLKLDLKFFYLPALEQFWPRPELKLPFLESKSMPNIFFIGDASGVAFGFLQCFITANYVLRETYGIH